MHLLMHIRTRALSGFTLVELLVVIALLSLILAMSQLQFTPWAKRSNDVAALVKVKQAINECLKRAKQSRHSVKCEPTSFSATETALIFYPDGSSNGSRLYSSDLGSVLSIDPLTSHVSVLQFVPVVSDEE